MATLEYNVSARVDTNTGAVYWTGVYDNLYMSRNNPVLTTCCTGISRHLRATRGAVHAHKDNTVTGKVTIDGNEWNFEFKDCSYRLYNDTSDEKGPYLSTMLKNLTPSLENVTFGDLAGSAFIYQVGGTIVQPSTPDAKPDPTPAPPADSDSDSDVGFDIDIFG